MGDRATQSHGLPRRLREVADATTPAEQGELGVRLYRVLRARAEETGRATVSLPMSELSEQFTPEEAFLALEALEDIGAVRALRPTWHRFRVRLLPRSAIQA